MATTTSIHHHVSGTKWLNVSAGLTSALGMGIFFLIMRALKLHYVLELRFFNIVFLFCAVLYTFRRYKAVHGEIGYLQGLVEGLKTTLVNILAFDLFFVIYLLKIDPHFMEYIIKEAPFGSFLNVWLVAGNIFGEGFASGAIVSFMFMQYYKSEKSETI
ncbi:MAG: DUF4199 family protein [Bacteroidia bacterium]